MKRFPIAAAVLAFLAFACIEPGSNEPQEPDDKTPEIPETPEKVNPQPGVYKFVLGDDCPGKAAWDAGDEILLTGGYTPDNITVKIGASDISPDGRTATVNLAKVPEFVYGQDDFYAGYPADAIQIESTFCENNFEFNCADRALVCAWLSGDTFTFHGVCAALTVSLPGDWDNCVLSGTNWEYVLFDNCTARAGSASGIYDVHLGAGHYYQSVSVRDGKATFYFPNGIKLSDGARLFPSKGGAYAKVFDASGFTLKAGEAKELGDITSSLQDYDGPAPKDPEMPKMGSYTKFSIGKIPELSGICLNADKTALWGVGDNGLLGIIEFDGTVTKTWKPAHSCGMEDISINPSTGELYIADEDYHRVVSVNPADIDFNESKVPFTEIIKVQAAVTGKYGNSSVEGVAYYKDNIVFVGTQVGANLWKYTTEGEELWMVSLRKLTSNAISEVGGLCYDQKNHWLWVIDSETQKMYVLDEDVTHILATYPVRFAGNSESVCVDPGHGCVWVGDDSDSTSKLFKIEFEGL